MPVGDEGLDILQKNKFGRGALTEGFASRKTETVGLLLENKNATEERLIRVCERGEVEDGGLTKVDKGLLD